MWKGKRFQKLRLCQILSWFIFVVDMSDVSAHPTQIMAFTNKNTCTHVNITNQTQRRSNSGSSKGNNDTLTVHTKAQKLILVFTSSTDELAEKSSCIYTPTHTRTQVYYKDTARTPHLQKKCLFFIPCETMKLCHTEYNVALTNDFCALTFNSNSNNARFRMIYRIGVTYRQIYIFASQLPQLEHIILWNELNDSYAKPHLHVVPPFFART